MTLNSEGQPPKLLDQMQGVWRVQRYALRTEQAGLSPCVLKWWWEKDSNLRRRKPADLQSALVGHLSILPRSWAPKAKRESSETGGLVNPVLVP